MSEWMSPPVEVKLIDGIVRPYETAVGAARTCYSSKGVVYPEEVSRTKRLRAVRDRIASSTLLAGHLTTRQHATFVFAVSNVSRAAVWSFLHSHPFYNSEQVSQRYVEVKEGSFAAPRLEGEALSVYENCVRGLMEAYRSLVDAVLPAVETEFYALFPARRKRPERWTSFLRRKAYEAARYALPTAAHTYLYHTVSALTLIRYARLCDHFDVPGEQRELVEKMAAAVQELDPLFDRELEDPIPLESTPEYRFFEERGGLVDFDRARRFTEQFDADLEGRSSALWSWSARGEAGAADAARAVLGVPRTDMPDEEALSLLLDPSRNRYFAETMNVHTMTKLSRAMNHAHYTFGKRLSHTADSQNQRHRMTPGSRPALAAHYTGRPDAVAPRIFEKSGAAMEIYERAVHLAYGSVNRLLEMGVSAESALYLLPNGHAVRMVESGSLLDFAHKWRTRLCYTAQEEIFHASVEEVEQVRAVHPQIGRYLHAPCWYRSRSGCAPYCPEGDRFCGVPVWKLEVEQFERVL